jgi:hypothetical protein
MALLWIFEFWSPVRRNIREGVEGGLQVVI